MFNTIASLVAPIAPLASKMVSHSLAAIGLGVNKPSSDPTPVTNTSAETKWATYVFWPGMPPKICVVVKPAKCVYYKQQDLINTVESNLHEIGVIFETIEVTSMAEYAPYAAAYEASAAFRSSTDKRVNGQFPYICLETVRTGELEYLSPDEIKSIKELKLMPVERQKEQARSFVNTFATAVPLRPRKKDDPEYLTEEEWLKAAHRAEKTAASTKAEAQDK